MGIKKIVIVGVGGTGCHVLKKLTGYDITVIDGDSVQESNLERQILYSEKDIGLKKVEVIKMNVLKIPEFISKENVSYLSDADLVIDCTDNFQARFIIDDFCKAHTINWIYTAAIRDIGNILFVDSEINFRKLFGDKEGNACSEGIQKEVLEIVGKKAADIATTFLETATYPKELLRYNLKNTDVLIIQVSRDNQNMLYHGSKTKNIQTLNPRSHGAVDGEKVVFAANSKAFALAMIHCTGKEIAFCDTNGTKYIDELKEGALKLLHQEGYLYEVSNNSFEGDKRLLPGELISHYPIKALSEEYIPNVFNKLKKEGVRLIPHPDVLVSMAERGLDSANPSQKHSKKRFDTLH